LLIQKIKELDAQKEEAIAELQQQRRDIENAYSQSVGSAQKTYDDAVARAIGVRDEWLSRIADELKLLGYEESSVPNGPATPMPAATGRRGRGRPPASKNRKKRATRKKAA